MRLSSIFLRHAGPAGERAAAEPALEARLEALVHTARGAWPDVALDDEVFLRYLAERLPAHRDPLDALETVRADELYLACGCFHGDRRALAAFEAQFLSAISLYLARSDALPGFTDEVKQAVRTRILVADEGLLPRIGRYDGQGPLGGWLRVVATRLAINLRLEQRARGVARDVSELPLQAPGPDPEIDFLKTRYRAELEAAFRATLASVDARDATVLALHFLEAMSADAIGALYRVSGRTVQRWIAEARGRILAETRRLLSERLRLQPAELDSVMGLAQSQLDVSLRALLDRS